MGTYGQYKTDRSLEVEKGIVVDLGDAGRFRCRRAGGANLSYEKEMQKLARPHRHKLKHGRMPNAEAEKMLATAFARTIVIGWEGVTGPDGELLQFSESACIDLFTDLPDLFADIREIVTEDAAFREQLREDDQGN